MERMIGEIFEFNGEWYQCVEGYSCGKCSLHTTECGSGIKSDLADEVFGECSKIRRSDSKHVIFKKLEKVGEPFKRNGYLYQEYKAHTYPLLMNGEAKLPTVNGFAVKIKQNKEDMEEKKPNMKPFDLEAAKAGKPVVTMDGRKARIICFDRNDLYPIVALIECEDGKEIIGAYSKEGQTEIYEIKGTNLMMLPEKKEGWAVIRRSDIYENEGQAKEAMLNSHIAVMIKKIIWEE